MVSRRTRTLVDIALLLATAWFWIAIYESFTRSGLWLILSRIVGGATTLPSELALLSLSVLAGWLCVAALFWLAWRVIAPRELHPDFPVARLRSYYARRSLAVHRAS